MSSIKASRSGLRLVGFMAASFTAGAIGSLATFANVRTWYPLLHKPSWNPPSWIFGPVWTVLYVLMAVAIWRAWRASSSDAVRSRLVIGYFGQLALNAGWSIIFFGLKQPAWAFIDIIALWALLVALQIDIRRTDRLAGWLWLPYLLWVSFAAALNLAIVWLN
jgi:tryptophan-rich sensory protein